MNIIYRCAALFFDIRGVMATNHFSSVIYKAEVSILIFFSQILLHLRKLTACGCTPCSIKNSSNPRRRRTRVAFGKSWMPAPVSESPSIASRTVTECPALAKLRDALNPPIPPPIITKWSPKLTDSLGFCILIAYVKSSEVYNSMIIS